MSAPIILVPGFWLGAWAWDEVAGKLRADGHDLAALTLPGLEPADADRCWVHFADHVDAIVRAIEAADGPVVLAVHSATGYSGYAASDCVPERIAAMVYVDTAPGKPPLDPAFAGDEKPLVWDDLAAEENLDGLSEAQLAAFRERAVPLLVRCCGRATRSRMTPAGTSPRRSSRPDTGGRLPDVRQGAPGLVVPRGDPRAPRHHLDRPADEPLANVVAPDRARRDHR